MPYFYCLKPPVVGQVVGIMSLGSFWIVDWKHASLLSVMLTVDLVQRSIRLRNFPSISSLLMIFGRKQHNSVKQLPFNLKMNKFKIKKGFFWKISFYWKELWLPEKLQMLCSEVPCTHCLCCATSLQSSLTLCNPLDCDPQVPVSMECSRQGYWSGLPCPPPGDLPGPGIEPMTLTSPALAGGFFTAADTYCLVFPNWIRLT